MCFKLYVKYNVKSFLLQKKIHFLTILVVNTISKENHLRKNNGNTDLKYPMVILFS